MTDSASEKKQPPGLYEMGIHYFFVRLPVYLSLICVGYVLAIGPLFWRWHRAVYMGDGNEYITQIYYPLAWVCQNNETISTWVNNYIDLWVA